MENKLDRTGKAIGKRKNNGRPKGSKNLKTIAKEAIGQDEFYKIARRKQGGAKDVIEMLFAKAIAEKDTVAAKIIVDKLMPNAERGEKKQGNVGITINISDMKAVSIKDEDVIDGEIIE